MSVLARLKRCAGCSEDGARLKCSKCDTPYCSRECQRKCWKDHRSQCRPSVRLSVLLLPVDGEPYVDTVVVPRGSGGHLLVALDVEMKRAYGTSEVEIYDMAILAENDREAEEALRLPSCRYLTLMFDECAKNSHSRPNPHLIEAGIYGVGDVVVFSTRGSVEGVEEESPSSLPPLDTVKTCMTAYAERFAWLKKEIDSFNFREMRIAEDSMYADMIRSDTRHMENSDPSSLGPGMRQLGCVTSLGAARTMHKGVIVEIDALTLTHKTRTLAMAPCAVMVPPKEAHDPQGYATRIMVEVHTHLEECLARSFVADQRAKRAAVETEKKDDEKNDDDQRVECVVCLEDMFSKGQECPNGHSTCAACWSDWKREQASRGIKIPTCVFCREPVRPKKKASASSGGKRKGRKKR
nr:MYND finger domain-containing protein [Oceanusvirus sp.]